MNKYYCLSIQEPYASLIREGHKRFETRGHRINYRGEIIIHSSKQFYPLTQNEWKSINAVGVSNYKHGIFHCKANLVDCIYMDESFVEKMKRENPKEYALGFYSVGRYAWVLEDVVPFNVEAQKVVRGYPGLWCYKTEEDL